MVYFEKIEGDKEEELNLAEQEQELPFEIEEKQKQGKLRTGYTTGTSAAAATKGSTFSFDIWQNCR